VRLNPTRVAQFSDLDAGHRGFQPARQALGRAGLGMVENLHHYNKLPVIIPGIAAFKVPGRLMNVMLLG
jgi:hypothetical protein